MRRKALLTSVLVLFLPFVSGSSTGAIAASDEPARAVAPGQPPDDDLLITGPWRGEVEGSMSRGTDLLTVGYEMKGEFWFSVGADGRIDEGTAVVTYTPTFDASGLNEALDEAGSLGELGSIFPFPIPVGTALSDLLAVRGQYEEPMSTIEGAITGGLADDGTLLIAWNDVEQIELPITIFIDGAGGTSEEIAQESLATGTPWPDRATVGGDGGVIRAESVTEDRSQDGDVVTISTTTWRAWPESAVVPGGSTGQPPSAPRRDSWQVRFHLPTRAQAENQLAALTVAPEGSMNGFTRAQFGLTTRDWTVDEEGCTTRQVVLQLDAVTPPTLDPESCKLVAGSWFSPYDLEFLRSSSQVAIDHVVALGEAWRSGASTWTLQERVDFANDIDSPQLLSVSQSVNSSKQDSDPASWVPPWQGFDCDYARMWINVKFIYHLSLQQEERDVLEDMLTSCPRS
jgi:hypothetical protein